MKIHSTQTRININGYLITCHPKDRKTIAYKLNGLPQTMRNEVVSQYSTLFQDTETNYRQEAQKDGSQDNNPVLAKQAQEAARNRANAYLNSIVKMARNHAGKNDYLDSKDRFRLEFLMIWEKQSPDLSLLTEEQHGELNGDSAKQLKRQRRARWKAIRAFCEKENVTFPSSGTQDNVDGNGTKFNKLVSRDWLSKQFKKRSKKGEQHRARCACRIGKHADPAMTEEAFQEWLQGQKDSYQYMKDSVFISTEDDEVDMLTVYNSSNANPKNRKIKVITLLTGLVKYAEEHGYPIFVYKNQQVIDIYLKPKNISIKISDLILKITL